MDNLQAVNPASPAARIGLKIEKPKDQRINAFFNFLLIVSLLLLAGTLWVLALEYLHLPIPEWLLEFFDEVSLIFA